MMMLTAHAYQEIRDMRNNNFDPNGRHHPMLGILHMGDCCRFSLYVSVSNTMIIGYQGNNFLFRTRYGQIGRIQVNAEGQTIGSFNLWLQANYIPSILEMPECPMKVPNSTGFILTPLVLEIPFATINGTCYLRHHSKYSDQDVGLLCIFMAAGRLNLDITDNDKSISIIALPW
jgi:hypothetical protein